MPKTKAIVPEIIKPESEPEEGLAVLINTAYQYPCKDIHELSKHSGLTVQVIREAQKKADVDLVKLSNFKTNFAPSLIHNIRKIMMMITEMTKTKEPDAMKLQKYTQSLKTLNDMLKDIEGRTMNKNVTKTRTFRVSELIETYYEREPKQVN